MSEDTTRAALAAALDEWRKAPVAGFGWTGWDAGYAAAQKAVGDIIAAAGVPVRAEGAREANEALARAILLDPPMVPAPSAPAPGEGEGLSDDEQAAIEARLFPASERAVRAIGCPDCAALRARVAELERSACTHPSGAACAWRADARTDAANPDLRAARAALQPGDVPAGGGDGR